MMMPEMDGYETMRVIRQDPAATPCRSSPSPQGHGGDREKCLDAGASRLRLQAGRRGPASRRPARPARTRPRGRGRAGLPRRRRAERTTHDGDCDASGGTPRGCRRSGQGPRRAGSGHGEDPRRRRRCAQSPCRHGDTACARAGDRHCRLRRGGVARRPPGRFRGHPARRADAPHRRLRGRRAGARAAALVAGADHLSHGLQQGRPARLPRLLGGRGRLRVQADRAPGAQVEGRRVRRPLPQDRGDPPSGRGGAPAAAREPARARREARRGTRAAAARGASVAGPARAPDRALHRADRGRPPAAALHQRRRRGDHRLRAGRLPERRRFLDRAAASRRPGRRARRARGAAADGLRDPGVSLALRGRHRTLHPRPGGADPRRGRQPAARSSGCGST